MIQCIIFVRINETMKCVNFTYDCYQSIKKVKIFISDCSLWYYFCYLLVFCGCFLLLLFEKWCDAKNKNAMLLVDG